MTNLTAETVTTALDELIAERGEDFTYERAEIVYPSGYVDKVYAYSNSDGTPSCIVGCVLAKVEPEAFQKLHNLEWSSDPGGFTATGSVYSIADDYLSAELPELRDAETHGLSPLGLALRAAQSVQDGGAPWSEARNAFLTNLNKGDA